MRFMVIVKSTPEIEAGEIPAEEMTAMFEAMGKYN
ncbi:MAG: YciI family protein, partial [Dehalococcoidia bacterium]